jgi:hypothetical protein
MPNFPFARRVCVLAAACALLVLSACSALNPPTATPVPFARFTADQVLAAFESAGALVRNPAREMLVGRDAPATFSDRVLFEIPRIAPAGGQILVFSTPESLAEWRAYIDRLRADPDTRRDVIFVYENANLLLQLNAGLTPQEADVYGLAFQRMN